MLKDTVSIDVQGFFDNNNNFILKEIGTVFEKEPNMNNSFLMPCDFTLLNTHQNIFWNDEENSFLQTRKCLRTITIGKQIICKGVEKK